MHGPTTLAGFILFIILLGLSWLVYRLLIKVFPIYKKPVIKYGYWLFTTVSIILLAITRVIPVSAFASELSRLVFVWIMGQIFLLVLLPLVYAAFWLFPTYRSRERGTSSGTGINRRNFLKTALTGIVPVAAFGTASYGVFSGGSHITTQYHEVKWPVLPDYLEGFKIAQISDTHVGFYFSIEKLEEALALVRREKPDLLVITGDLVDDLSLLEPMIDKLTELAAEIKNGIYFSWGNHEYFRNIAKIREALQNSPIRVLANSNQLIIDGKQPFYLAGVDYPWADNGQEQSIKRAAMFAQANQGIPEHAFRILLSHHPDFIYNAFEAQVPLTLTGHTHGGQVALFGQSLLPLKYHYMRGLYREHEAYGYVSAGTGSWFPFRLGCPAEVSIFRLQKS